MGRRIFHHPRMHRYVGLMARLALLTVCCALLLSGTALSADPTPPASGDQTTQPGDDPVDPGEQPESIDFLGDGQGTKEDDLLSGTDGPDRNFGLEGADLI